MKACGIASLIRPKLSKSDMGLQRNGHFYIMPLSDILLKLLRMTILGNLSYHFDIDDNSGSCSN